MSVVLKLSRERIDRIVSNDIYVIAMKYGPSLSRAQRFYLLEKETNNAVACVFTDQRWKSHIPYNMSEHCENVCAGTGYTREEICTMASSSVGKGGSASFYRIKKVVVYNKPKSVEKFGLKCPPILWQYAKVDYDDVEVIDND